MTCTPAKEKRTENVPLSPVENRLHKGGMEVGVHVLKDLTILVESIRDTTAASQSHASLIVFCLSLHRHQFLAVAGIGCDANLDAHHSSIIPTLESVRTPERVDAVERPSWQ